MIRRLHITGSARRDADASLLADTHALVCLVTKGWATRGGGLVVGVVAEPLHGSDDPLPTVFDWTVIRTVADVVTRGEGPAKVDDGPILALRGSRRAYEQVTAAHAELLTQLTDLGAIDLQLLPDTWRSGALVRRMQAELGGALLILSGGAGVEDLANLYIAADRPVIPIDVDLGSSQHDGAQGGGTGLARRALNDSDSFLQLADGTNAGARLAALSMGPARAAVEVTAARILALLEDLEPPRAFCVRLLDPAHPHFEEVETFMQQVARPVLEASGLRVVDFACDRQDGAWMNAEIFDQLHTADTVLVDLTGQRPNCYLELGYALGRGHRTTVTARAGENMAFDADKLPWHFWTPGSDPDNERARMREHLRKFGVRAPLVATNRLV